MNRPTSIIPESEVVVNGEIKLIRVMSPAQVKEREALNVANTASALRARVVSEQAKTNGHARTSI